MKVAPHDYVKIKAQVNVCWTGGEKEIRNEPPRGTNCKRRMRKQFPQEAKSENISNPVEKNKTETKTEEASETITDTNESERESGGRSKRCTRYEARHAMEK